MTPILRLLLSASVITLIVACSPASALAAGLLQIKGKAFPLINSSVLSTSDSKGLIHRVAVRMSFFDNALPIAFLAEHLSSEGTASDPLTLKLYPQNTSGASQEIKTFANVEVKAIEFPNGQGTNVIAVVEIKFESRTLTVSAGPLPQPATGANLLRRARFTVDALQSEQGVPRSLTLVPCANRACDSVENFVVSVSKTAAWRPWFETTIAASSSNISARIDYHKDGALGFTILLDGVRPVSMIDVPPQDGPSGGASTNEAEAARITFSARRATWRLP